MRYLVGPEMWLVGDVPLPAADVRDLLRERELLLAAEQLLVGGMAFGDVADDAAEVATVRALPAGDRELERELRPVLVHAGELQRAARQLGAACRAHALEPGAVALAVALRHQDGQGLPDRLLGPVAEHLRGAGAPEQDQAGGVGQQDRLGGGLGDRAGTAPRSRAAHPRSPCARSRCPSAPRRPRRCRAAGSRRDGPRARRTR